MLFRSFRDHNLALLEPQSAVHRAATQLMQTAREASEELATSFEAHREEGKPKARNVSACCVKPHHPRRHRTQLSILIGLANKLHAKRHALHGEQRQAECG